MNHIIIVAVLSVSCALGAQLNSYLPPRGGAGSGAGLITGPSYTGAGGFNTGAGRYNTGAGGYNTGAYTGAGAGSGAFGGAPSGPVIPIISYENNPNQGDGTYSYSYQTGNGITAQESGRVTGPESGTAAQGSYSYTGPDGQQYTITYTADANGFVAQGAHLPTPPPIPEAILKSLAFNAANPQSEFNTGGSGSYSGAGSGSYGAPRPNYGAPGTSFSPSTGYHYKK